MTKIETMANLEGFDATMRAICAETCATEYGEPPCWRLRELTSDCQETIRPCDGCLIIAGRQIKEKDSD